LQSTLYGAKYDNQENKIGLGNIYRILGSEGTASQDGGMRASAFDSFSEEPNVFYVKNRFTYNATSIIPNKGMLSHIKNNADILNDFPAYGIGKTYEDVVTDSSSSTTYTLTEKLNAFIGQIPTGYMFTLPEGSSVETSNTTRYTFKYGDGTNFSYTRYAPTSSTIFSRQVSFSGAPNEGCMEIQYRTSSLENYNAASYGFPKIIVLPRVKSIKVDDVLVVAGNRIVQGNEIFTASNAFSCTYINNQNNTVTSIINDASGSTIFSSNAVLRTIDVFFPADQENFPTGWAIPTQEYPSFLSFTNYFGSSYIDI